MDHHLTVGDILCGHNCYATGRRVKPVAHVATFPLATFAWQSVKLNISCRGKEVGENWGGGGYLENGENCEEKVAKHSHMLQLFHGTFFFKKDPI